MIHNRSDNRYTTMIVLPYRRNNSNVAFAIDHEIDWHWDNMMLPRFRYYEIRSDLWLKWKSLILEASIQTMFPSIRLGEVYFSFPRSRNCRHICQLRHCEANWSETSSSRCWIWLLWGHAKSCPTPPSVGFSCGPFLNGAIGDVWCVAKLMHVLEDEQVGFSYWWEVQIPRVWLSYLIVKTFLN